MNTKLIGVSAIVAVVALLGFYGATDDSRQAQDSGEFSYSYPQPTTHHSFAESSAGFRRLELWRPFYNLKSTMPAWQFCKNGDYHYRPGKVYRHLPDYERQAPYMKSLYRSRNLGGEVPLPNDGHLFHVTLVYRDKATDPASQHLANSFMAKDHWLSHLKDNSHFRTVSYNDGFWNSWIKPNFGLTQQDLPAVIVTETVEKRSDDPAHRQHGRLVYYAPAHSMPWNPDTLAYEIWTQMRKGPYADQGVGSQVQTIRQTSLLGQCGPNCPQPDNRPDDGGRRLRPLRPGINLNVGLTPETKILLGVFAAIVLIVGAFLYVKSQKGAGPW